MPRGGRYAPRRAAAERRAGPLGACGFAAQCDDTGRRTGGKFYRLDAMKCAQIGGKWLHTRRVSGIFRPVRFYFGTKLRKPMKYFWGGLRGAEPHKYLSMVVEIWMVYAKF